MEKYATTARENFQDFLPLWVKQILEKLQEMVLVCSLLEKLNRNVDFQTLQVGYVVW